MRRAITIVTLTLLAALPACAQPYYGVTPVYPGYSAPYTAAPRYWGGGGQYRHYSPPQHHHYAPRHHHWGYRPYGGGYHHGGRHHGAHRF